MRTIVHIGPGQWKLKNEKWTIREIRKVRAEVEGKGLSKNSWKNSRDLKEWMAVYRYDRALLRTSSIKRNQLAGWLGLGREEFVDEVLRTALLHRDRVSLTRELCNALSGLGVDDGSRKGLDGGCGEPVTECCQDNLVDEIMRVALSHKDSSNIMINLMHMSSQLLREYDGKAEVRASVTLPLSELKMLLKKILFLLRRDMNSSPRACVRLMTDGEHLTAAVEKQSSLELPWMQVQARTKRLAVTGIFSRRLWFDVSKNFCRTLRTMQGSAVTIECFEYRARILIDGGTAYETRLTRGIPLFGLDHAREIRSFISAPRNELVRIFRDLRERFPYVWINMYMGEDFERKAVRFQASNKKTGDRIDKRFKGVEWEGDNRRVRVSTKLMWRLLYEAHEGNIYIGFSGKPVWTCVRSEDKLYECWGYLDKPGSCCGVRVKGLWNWDGMDLRWWFAAKRELAVE